ncbi:tripartite tricarboxylate transporter substrate-binding protein [Roseomonas sp. BN140053]|uniref:tripartite tricarboxylate transporter substrate-binding protein n=1 Tax=Roseomonas sp. BN140053 TaxID=3391898 RepID=UPI0039ED137E
MLTNFTRRAALATLLAAPALSLRAQGIAEGKPIRLVVPFAPGGSPDIIARLVAPELSRALGGQPVVVDNRPGANGGIGIGGVVRATPDGTTLLVGNLGTLAINPAVYEQLPYDPKALTPITRAGTSALVLAVPGSSDIRTVGELVARAKARPRELTYSSGGNGTASHLAAAFFTQLAGIEMLHVPYRSTVAAATALVTSEVNCNFGGQGAVWPLTEGGQVRAIAVTGAQREPGREVPTVIEGGLPGFEVVDWFGVLAPAGMAPALVGQLNAALNAILAQPEIAAKLAVQGILAGGGTPEQFATFTAAEQEKWARTARAAQIKVE